MLAVSGTLNPEPYGPAFKPPIPAEAMVARNTKSPVSRRTPRTTPATRRRSVYMFHKRVVPYPLLQAFDRPDAQQAAAAAIRPPSPRRPWRCSTTRSSAPGPSSSPTG